MSFLHHPFRGRTLGRHRDGPAELGDAQHPRHQAKRLFVVCVIALLILGTNVPLNAVQPKGSYPARAAELGEQQADGGRGRGNTQGVTATGADPVAVTRDENSVTSVRDVYGLTGVRLANTFTNNPNGSIQWPFRVGVPISDGFGARTAPRAGASTFHQGVDFTPGAGVPIQAIAEGTVRAVVLANDNSCGVHVEIDHVIAGQQVSSVYCHMQVGSVPVTRGQRVSVADIVGRVGNTGVSTGAHLHFEIRLGGTRSTDPVLWLRANAR